MISRMGVYPGRPSWMAWRCLRGGALLLTPGILTDLIGFGLLFPGTRYAIQKRIMARLERHIQEGAVHVKVTGGEIWTRSSDPMSSDPISPSRSAGE